MNQCIFCDIIAKREPADIVYEDEYCVVFLDKHPQTVGHMQLAPRTHYRWIWEVPEMGKLFDTAGRIIRGIIPLLGATHATLATFGSQVAHAHIWIVPQYGKDMRVAECCKATYGMKGIDQTAARIAQALSKEV